PSKTDDLYFVADGTGGHVFAATLEEHNENVARYRALLKKQADDAAKAGKGTDQTGADKPADTGDDGDGSDTGDNGDAGGDAGAAQ
ncbi:MAG: 4-amino-4-deoxychorismate lyase, partial [Betaproteobacteria bacterium]